MVNLTTGFHSFTPNIDIELEPIKAKVSMAYFGDGGLKVFDSRLPLNFDIPKLLANTPYLIYVKEAIELDGSVGAVEGGASAEEIATFQSQIDSLNSDIESKDNQIGTLNSTISTKDSEINTLNSDIESKDNEILSLNSIDYGGVYIDKTPLVKNFDGIDYSLEYCKAQFNLLELVNHLNLGSGQVAKFSLSLGKLFYYDKTFSFGIFRSSVHYDGSKLTATFPLDFAKNSGNRVTLIFDSSTNLYLFDVNNMTYVAFYFEESTNKFCVRRI